MIVDTMTKDEVMSALRKDFDNELMPYIAARKRMYEAQIRHRAIKEKRIISLEWESFESSNKISFHYQIKGDNTNCIQTHIAEFLWRGSKCYAYFFENDKTVVVFQEHCLERYSQRVLNMNLNVKEIFYNHLIKRISDSFHIVLPCPKREASEYLVFADALFLGDYIIPSSKDDPCHIWCNTCISLNEAHTSQSGIIKSLYFMQKYIYQKEIDPIKDRKKYREIRKSIKKKDKDRAALIEFFKKYHMMIQLSLSFDIPKKELFVDEMKEILSFIDAELASMRVDTSTLDPYGPDGFAVKGEIDYRCN